MNDRVKPTFGIAVLSYNEKQALAEVAWEKVILLRGPRLKGRISRTSAIKGLMRLNATGLCTWT